jgi:hypothetical protein
MDYFDGLTDAKFKTDAQRRLLFYPWGILSKGYVLPDESKKQQIRRFVRLYYIVFWPVIIGTMIFIGWIFSFAVMFLLFLWYYFETSRFLKGLPIAGEKLSLSESYTSSAKSHNMATLWILLIFSVLFVLSGFAILVHNRDAWFIGLASIIFFGASSLANGYMIKVKNAGR